MFVLGKLPVLSVCVLLMLISCSQVSGGDKPLLDKETMKPKGQFYESKVPATLDLAERAKLSVNVLTRNSDPDLAYSVYHSFNYNNNITMSGLTWNILCKNVRALPMMRCMTGSEYNLDTEYNMMKALVDNQYDKDGLIYYPVDGEANPKDTSYSYTNGMTALAMLAWYERDGNPLWIDHAYKICKGLTKMAIEVEDRAYYPPESGYKKEDGSWHWTLRGEAKIPYTPPAEPEVEQQGLEGTVKYDQASPMRAMTKICQIKEDKQLMELTDKLVRFCMKPGMWEDTTEEGYPGNEHGVWAGHYHGNTTSFHALLDYAIARNDTNLKQIIKEAYNHAVKQGSLRVGYYRPWLRPEKHHRPLSGLYLCNETCAVADMVVLAVKLSDAGLGDYWDDVDSMMRNHYITQQHVNLEEMSKIANATTKEDEEKLQRFKGGFGMGAVTSTAPDIYSCCTVNGAVGMYYAWDGITRFDDGIATVNLFLNRASKWLDIDSYLPYEGKVVLKNKLAKMALVRIPAWIDKNKLSVYLNDKKMAKKTLVGNYLSVSNLKKSDVIRLEFDIPETTEKIFLIDKDYTIAFRGSTVVDISPRDTDPQKYQYFNREHMKDQKTPMRTVKRFVSDKLIPLQ